MNNLEHLAGKKLLILGGNPETGRGTQIPSAQTPDLPQAPVYRQVNITRTQKQVTVL